MGIPTVFITALPTIAQMVGANRIVRGVAITHPTGDPGRTPYDERHWREEFLLSSLRALQATPEANQVFEPSTELRVLAASH